MNRNINPVEPWNRHDKNNLAAPWNDPSKRNDPTACWNNPVGEGKYRDEVDNFNH